MPTTRLAYYFLGAFCLTLFSLQWWQDPQYPHELWLVLFACIPIGWRWRWPVAASAGVIIALAMVGRTTHVTTVNSVDSYATEQTVVLTGKIVAEPDRRPLKTKYTIAVNQVRTSSGVVHNGVHGLVLVTDHAMWPSYHYGDTITAKGTLERPEQIETFAYDRYLSRFNVYAVMYRGSLRLVHEESVWSIHRALFAIKQAFESQINRLYGEPHASFMAGLLTGSRRGIPEGLMEDFNVTGLTHIIAISGYNITIIIAIISSLLCWLPVKVRFYPAVIAIVLFTIFVGASAAVVRAAIMGILGLIALQLGRLSTVRLTVLWTLFFMLCYNPKYLWYDAGFQLSFLAVVGLTELSPLLDRWFSWAPTTLGIRESLQMTIAAQLAAVPLIVTLFGRLSLIAPIANMLVAPLLPLAMLFGFLGTTMSMVWFPLGQLCAFIGWGCLEWVLFVTKICSKAPLASVDITMGPLDLAIYYILLLAYVYHTYKRSCRSPDSQGTVRSSTALRPAN